MAIGTNNELRTAVANWLGKANLTTRIPEFIALAEKRLDRAFAKRAAGAETVVTSLSTATEVIDLPADFLAVRLLLLDLGTRQVVVEYRTPDRLFRDWPATGAQMPRWFTLHGKGDHQQRSSCGGARSPTRPTARSSSTTRRSPR